MKTNTQHSKSSKLSDKPEHDTIECMASLLGVEADHGEESLVQIFPTKSEWYGADGRGPFRLSDPEAVAALSNQDDSLKGAMIDRDHQRQLAPKGEPVKAAGWFKEFIVQDGTLYGRASWTPSAQEELAHKEYRFFSASFLVNRTTREIMRVTGGSLTNTPNFRNMEALASEHKQPCKKETSIMETELEKLAKRLGLKADVPLEEVVASVNAALDTQSEQEETLASIKKNLELKDNCALEEVVAAAQKPESVDLSRYVPKESYEALATKLNEREKSDAEEVVASAMRDGKITPAMKEWATQHAEENLASFKSFVENAPKVIADAQPANQQRANTQSHNHSSEMLEIASQMGLSAQDLVD